MRFGRSRDQRLDAEPISEVAQSGYWEDRLRDVGSRFDLTRADLGSVAFSVAAGDVWVAGVDADPVRSFAGLRPLSFRLEGVGINMPVGTNRDGKWATRLRAVGWALDHQPGTMREPCVMYLDPGFFVFARMETPTGWQMVNLKLSETGMHA